MAEHTSPTTVSNAKARANEKLIWAENRPNRLKNNLLHALKEAFDEF